ncbi:MAG: hypothetical protein EB127_05230, partial [Alphaproteobacteria bacterium]|nr:hypothetical protein [Alphaproteobacteria bacterium]
MPYIKGYVIAGQIDSVINLDQALKSMFKKCAKDKKRNMKHVCEFSTDYLLSFVPNATMEQKNQIALVAGALSPENLAPKFLDKTTLKMMGTKKLYEIDIASIIDRGMV